MPARTATVQQIEKELQETKERLQSTIEELETANEEFRSANEELLSVNEELQSTNEELETSKEELQSVNEELQTVNGELSYKIDELDRANSDLNNLFQSTQIATDLSRPQSGDPQLHAGGHQDLFNLIPGDRGRPLTDIVSRIGYPDLEDDMRAVFGGGEPVERAVSLAGGKSHYLARILPYRGADNTIDGVLLTFVDVTSIVAAEEQQKVLAAELSHRVKNTLAVVSSIAERTLPDGETKTDLIGRLHALGHTHDLLSQGGWTEASLRDVILAELAPHAAGDGANLSVERAAGHAEAAGRAVYDPGHARAVDQRGEIRCSVGARRSGRDRLEHRRRSAAAPGADMAGKRRPDDRWARRDAALARN